MYNSRFIITAALVVLALFTSPFWLSKSGYKRPDVQLPAVEKECVESAAFMRAEHMQLLNEWRDQALRNENRVYVAKNGRKWEISLQNTCLKCHNDTEKFCDACHISNSVYPYCWTCHIELKGKGGK
jgi:hypothetical protein